VLFVKVHIFPKIARWMSFIGILRYQLSNV